MALFNAINASAFTIGVRKVFGLYSLCAFKGTKKEILDGMERRLMVFGDTFDLVESVM